MKPINYQLTNQMVNLIAEIEREDTANRYKPLTGDIRKELLENNMVRSIMHFGQILGLNITHKEAINLCNAKQPESEDIKWILLRNLRQSLEYIRSTMKSSYNDVNLELLLHLNRILVQDWKDQWSAKVRTTLQPNIEFEQWINMMDETVEIHEVEQELEKTFDWYKNNITRIHPLIRIPVMIYRIVRLAPFNSLNQLLTISLADLLIQKYGYTEHSFVSSPKIFNTNSEAFMKSWQEAVATPTGNITTWIETFLTHIKAEISLGAAEIDSALARAESKKDKPFLNLNKRQLRILRYLQTIPSLKREDYVQMFEISSMTAFRDLKGLLDAKLLKTEGEGRATRYKLSTK